MPCECKKDTCPECCKAKTAGLDHLREALVKAAALGGGLGKNLSSGLKPSGLMKGPGGKGPSVGFSVGGNNISASIPNPVSARGPSI